MDAPIPPVCNMSGAEGQQAGIGASMPEFEDYKDQSHSFEYIANMLSGWTITWTGQGEPRTVNCTGSSYDFFARLRWVPEDAGSHSQKRRALSWRVRSSKSLMVSAAACWGACYNDVCCRRTAQGRRACDQLLLFGRT